SRGRVEPQPVAKYGTSTAWIDVEGALQPVRFLHTTVHEVPTEVRALPRLANSGREDGSSECIPALTRDDIDSQSPRQVLGLHRRVIDRHFLGGARVGHVVGPLALAGDVAGT